MAAIPDKVRASLVQKLTDRVDEFFIKETGEKHPFMVILFPEEGYDGGTSSNCLLNQYIVERLIDLAFHMQTQMEVNEIIRVNS